MSLTLFVLLRVETKFSRMFQLVANETFARENQRVNNKITILEFNKWVNMNHMFRKMHRDNKLRRQYRCRNHKDRNHKSNNINKVKELLLCDSLFDLFLFDSFLIVVHSRKYDSNLDQNIELTWIYVQRFSERKWKLFE